jgi:hypothetical protein
VPPCGSYTSVSDLITKTRAYITGGNDRATPFAWSKTRDQILIKANRQKTSHTEH